MKEENRNFLKAAFPGIADAEIDRLPGGFDKWASLRQGGALQYYKMVAECYSSKYCTLRIKEGDKERIQVFQGVVIRKRNGQTGATFTVRKVSYGVGVERIFPLHSPNIDKVEIVSRGKVRRGRLYYLRKLRGKAARIKEKRI